MSNNDHNTACERHARAENFAAALVTAVYPLFLTHGFRESWLKTELILWKRLTRTIKRWIRERPRATPRELDVLRERLGGDLTTILGPYPTTTEESRAPNSGMPSGLTQSDGRQEGGVCTRLQPYAGALLIVLGLALGATGCARAPAAVPAAPAVPVTVSRPIECQVTDYVDFTSRTAAVDSVELRARVSGYLEKVNFKEGALVRKGAVLFKIDPRPYQAVYDSAVAQIKLNEAQMNQAIADNARARELAKTPGAISKQDLDKYAAIEATAAASVAAAKANAESARLNLEFTDVVSPIGGRASRYIVTVGNLVQAGDQGGGTLLTTIVSVDPMHANFDVDELTVQRARQFVRGGRLKSADESAIPVSLGLAAEEGFPHLGTINFVDNQVNPKTGTLRARGVFSNKDGALSPGYFARVRLPIGPAHRALLVNDRVVDNDQGQKVVYVVDKDHQVVSRPVRLGALHGGLREVRDGLMPGERVIVDGLQQVRPGTRVEAKLVPMPTPHVTHPNETTLTSGATP